MNPDSTQPLSSEAKDLEAHNKAIFEIVETASKRSTVNTELVERLKAVRIACLYRADKGDDGAPNFESYEDYIEWLTDEARKRLLRPA